MNSELQMTLALKTHGLMTIALVLSLSLSLDLRLAHLMGNAGGAPIVQMWGVGFNGTQIGLCLLAFAMSSWKACGLLHIRMAIRQKRCGYAAASAILLVCAVTISAVVELSWLDGHLITEVPAKPLQRGANLLTTLASPYFHGGILIVLLQLATATLPLIVFGDVFLADPEAEGTKVTRIQVAPAVAPTSTNDLTPTDQLPANLADVVPSTAAPSVQTEKTPVTEEPRFELRPPTSNAVFALAYASGLSAIARRSILGRALRQSAAKTWRGLPASEERPESSLSAPHRDRTGQACAANMAEQVGAGTLPVRPAERQKAGDLRRPLWATKTGVRAAQGALVPGSDKVPEAITADRVPTPTKSERTAASQQVSWAPANLGPVWTMALPAKRAGGPGFEGGSAPTRADRVPIPMEPGPTASSQKAGRPGPRFSPVQAMVRPDQRTWVPNPDIGTGPIPADPVPTPKGTGRIAADRWARGSRLPLSPSQAAADYLGWALAHGLDDRMWSVNDVWHMAAEDFALAMDIVLPPRNLFLGALKKLPGVRVQYDKRIWVGATRTKTTVYVFSSR